MEIGELSLGPEEYYGEYLGVGIRIKRLSRTETIDDFAIYSDRTDETLPEDAYFLGAFSAPRISHPIAIRLAARRWLERNKLQALRRLTAQQRLHFGDDPAESPSILF
jgi:hypothetical protein